MAEAIKVVCRFKGHEELNKAEQDMWEIDKTSIKAPNLHGKGHGNRNLEFTFDYILDGDATQDKMYHYAGADTVKQFTEGYNGTIFAYGMSGTGKTFSMLGPEEVVDVIKKGGDIPQETQALYGIIPRAIRDLFLFMNEATEKDQAQFQLTMNYFEIYLEKVNDLLNPNREMGKNLDFRGTKVKDSSDVSVQSPEDIFKYIQLGQRKVQTESTGMNARSSRSHTILQLEYLQLNKDGSTKNATLNLVDLAGSERIGKTGATGKVLEEAKSINTSLTMLSQVIEQLGKGAKGFIPFNRSKLTRLLQASLSGNAKTTLVCTLSKAQVHYDETVQSLQFASRVKKIKNKIKINIQLSPAQMEAKIAQLEAEVLELREKLSMDPAALQALLMREN